MRLVKLSEEEMEQAIIEYIKKHYHVDKVEPNPLNLQDTGIIVESFYKVEGAIDSEMRNQCK